MQTKQEWSRKGTDIMTDIKLGEKIMELRKAKKMTQDQLAGLLGVSAPAVSKWETDSSYPDITILCPLARALGTDVDTLLSYEETLTEEEQGRYMSEIMGMLREGKKEEAEERLEKLLHSYPSAVPLKFSAIAAFTMLEMYNSAETESGEGEKDAERWKARKRELAEAIYASGDSAYYLSSISMLVTLELADGNLDRAEELLKQAHGNTADFTMHWVQLYQKRGEPDKALETVQHNLYRRVSDIQNCLMLLLGDNMRFDREKTLEICRIFRRQEELFGVGGGMGSAVIAEVYLRLGMKQEALDYLEEFAQRLSEGWTLPNQILFYPAFSAGTMQVQPSAEIMHSIVKGLEQDDCLTELRGEERFQAIVAKLRKLL